MRLTIVDTLFLCNNAKSAVERASDRKRKGLMRFMCVDVVGLVLGLVGREEGACFCGILERFKENRDGFGFFGDWAGVSVWVGGVDCIIIFKGSVQLERANVLFFGFCCCKVIKRKRYLKF